MTHGRKKNGIGSHTRTRGRTDSWITPRRIIDAIGPFDLDPCRCVPQPWPCAKRGYTVRGLERVWHGRVFLNPPYSEIWAWMAKLAEHNHGTALIFARTETQGFITNVWKRATAIMFLHGRLHFHLPDGSKKRDSGGPSCLVAYGKADARKLQQSGLGGTLVWLTDTN